MVTLALSQSSWFMLTAVLFVVFALFRFSLNVGFLERPLLVGLAWALITGDVRTAMGVSLFFELLWIDLFPAGTYVPPHLVAATCAGLSLASGFGLSSPQDVLLCLLLAMPLGPVGAKLEDLLRTWQNRHYNTLVRVARQPDTSFAPERLILRSLLETALCSLIAFSLLLALLYAVLPRVLPVWHGMLPPARLGWVHLWLAASLGGVLAIRWKRAYGLLAAAAALLAMSGAFGSGTL